MDGFNLYYGALKHTPYRWLNLAALCRWYLPASQHDIRKIKYFTAKVSARPSDPDQPMRQQLYLRALHTLPEVEIFFGHFLTHAFTQELAPFVARWPGDKPKSNVIYANPGVAGAPGGPGGQDKAYVYRTEEKGSDVNLAVHLLNDAHRNDYDVAVVVSNDSDLSTPIRMVSRIYLKKIGVLNPHKHKASRTLAGPAAFVKEIRGGSLAKCMFPETISDAKGTFKKPPAW